MYLLYLDDSGSPSNKDEKNFVLAGCIIHESKLKWVNEKIEELATCIDNSNPQNVEFHASEIFSRRKGPWSEMSKPQVIEQIKSVLRVIPSESRDAGKLCVMGCVVEKACFPGHDPVELAFENLCSRFDLFLNRKYRETNERATGLIILDKSTSETTLQRLAIDFRNIGTRWNVTRTLHEVPMFVDSRASRGIQLADHVAYSLFRRYEHGDINYFNIIQSNFDADNERIHGLVHKTYDHGCTCPACLARRMST